MQEGFHNSKSSATLEVYFPSRWRPRNANYPSYSYCQVDCVIAVISRYQPSGSNFVLEFYFGRSTAVSPAGCCLMRPPSTTLASIYSQALVGSPSACAEFMKAPGRLEFLYIFARVLDDSCLCFTSCSKRAHPCTTSILREAEKVHSSSAISPTLGF
jgi:hypothetical protein